MEHGLPEPQYSYSELVELASMVRRWLWLAGFEQAASFAGHFSMVEPDQHIVGVVVDEIRSQYIADLIAEILFKWSQLLLEHRRLPYTLGVQSIKREKILKGTFWEVQVKILGGPEIYRNKK